MISHFFIRRPRAAYVLSILITLAGLISITHLSVNMYPEHITPPVVEVAAVYPGASASVVEQSVIQPLEDAINGTKGMSYMTSRSSNDGSTTIQVFFQGNIDADIATVNVQNAVARAASKLPSIVNEQGVTVTQGTGGGLVMGISLYSPDKSMNALEMSSYADHYVIDPLSRVAGVSKAYMMAEMRYSMRIWLNPNQMHALGISINEVKGAVEDQNAIIAAGKIGASPSEKEQRFEYTIEGQGRLVSPEEFGNIILKATSNGGYIRLHDVAKVELGSQYYNGQALLNNKPQVFIAINQLPASSALEVAAGVKQRIQALEKQFPENLKANIVFDTTNFISLSVIEVIKTLIAAILLVILVVFAFLQNWRATLIPALAIPVSLIGTFAFMAAFGISINLMTLFALVLAIGVVVDDAIIVIENVERHISEGMDPKKAAHLSMEEITGPILATTLVLLAVFGPVAFIPGVSGQLFKQFSIVLSISVIISSINALTLSPALCATLLKPGCLGHNKFLHPVDLLIQKITGKYNASVGWLLKRTGRILIVFAILLAGTGLLIKTLPSGFMPMEDQGYLFVNVQLPDAASLNRTDAVLRKITDIANQQAGVDNTVTISGFSMLSGNNANSAFAIIILKHWDLRSAKEEHAFAITQILQQKLSRIPNAQIRVIPPPTINVGDSISGFAFQLQDTSGHTPQELAQVANELIAKANQQPELQGVFTTFRANVPLYKLVIDRSKVKTLGVSFNDIYLTLQAQLGSLYLNDFNMNDKIYQVMIEAQPRFRSDINDLSHYYVHGDTGQMVPLSAFASLTPILGAPTLNHFNIYRSVTINGSEAPGYSSGDAIAAMERLAKELPEGYTHEWSGQTVEEIASGNQMPILFTLAILFVYLILVALYESWSIPVVVLAIIPIAIFGAAAALHVLEVASDIYVQIGMLLLIGMAAKSTILMAEFAVKCRSQGMTILEAAQASAKLRFRAVFMTALSFILGVAPLVLSSGAGANSRFNIGSTIIAGMITVTTAGILLTPIIYRVIQGVREKVRGEAAAKAVE